MTGRRLVGVSWCMPPALFPRSVQVARLLKGLTRLGWHSTIVTPTLATLPPTDTIDHDLGATYGSHYALVPVDGRREPAAASAVGRWRQQLSGELALSDEALWIRRAARATIAAVRQQRADALVTFAQPWRDHLVGLEVRKRLRRLPWVAHFSDPWTDSIYSQLTGAERDQELQREAAVIAQADRVVFTNEHAASLVMRKYPASQAKARVVPHAMDADLLPAAGTPANRDRFRLAHVGNLLVGRRTADALFDALVALGQRRRLDRELEVMFLGGGSGLLDARVRVFVQRLEPIVTFRERVPYRESLALMRDSDALLLIDAASDTNVFLPSKLVDYVMLGKPILALTPQAGASADALRRYGGTLVDPQDPAAIAAAIDDLLNRHHSGAIAHRAPGPEAEFGIDAVAGAFARLLEEIVRQ